MSPQASLGFRGHLITNFPHVMVLLISRFFLYRCMYVCVNMTVHVRVHMDDKANVHVYALLILFRLSYL